MHDTSLVCLCHKLHTIQLLAYPSSEYDKGSLTFHFMFGVGGQAELQFSPTHIIIITKGYENPYRFLLLVSSYIHIKPKNLCLFLCSLRMAIFLSGSGPNLAYDIIIPFGRSWAG